MASVVDKTDKTSYLLENNGLRLEIKGAEGRRFSKKNEKKLLDILHKVKGDSAFLKDGHIVTFEKAQLILQKHGITIELLEQDPSIVKDLRDRVDQLNKEIFPNSFLKTHIYLGRGAEYIYPFSDFSGMARMGMAIANVEHAEGTSAGLGLPHSFLTGPIAMEKGYRAFSHAGELKETSGKILGTINFLRGISETLSGATIFPVRVLSMLPTLSKTGEVAAKILGNMANAFAAGVYLGFIGISSYVLYKHAKYMKPLEKILSNKELSEEQKYEKALEYIKQRLTVSSKDVQKAGSKTLNKIEKKCQNEKKREIAAESISNTKLLDGAEKFLDESKQWLNENFAAKFKDNEDLFNSFNDREVFSGIVRRIANTLYCKSIKKEEKFRRYFGMNAWKAVKSNIDAAWSGLKEGSLEKAKEIVKAIKSDSAKQKLIHGLIISLCIIGIAGLVLSSVFTGGIGAIIAASLIMALAIGMAGIDMYFLVQALKNGAPNRNERILMTVFSILLITSVSLATVLSGGLVPLLVAGSVGTVWLALYLYMIAASYYYEKKKQEDETKRILQHRTELDS